MAGNDELMAMYRRADDRVSTADYEARVEAIFGLIRENLDDGKDEGDLEGWIAHGQVEGDETDNAPRLENLGTVWAGRRQPSTSRRAESEAFKAVRFSSSKPSVAARTALRRSSASRSRATET